MGDFRQAVLRLMRSGDGDAWCCKGAQSLRQALNLEEESSATPGSEVWLAGVASETVASEFAETEHERFTVHKLQLWWQPQGLVVHL